MKPTLITTALVALIALLAITAPAAAQTAPAILNSLELQQLVTRAEPADHARLSAHFSALAEEYAADARRHTTMARSFTGNPNRRVASMDAHCRRLAELRTQSAATLRELAGHHEALAAGKTSAVPRGATRFEAGEGAPTPSEAELTALAAKANTPADHRALAEYFQTLARRYTADANAHATMAQTYRGTRIAQSAVHCERLVALSRDAAREATAAGPAPHSRPARSPSRTRAT